MFPNADMQNNYGHATAFSCMSIYKYAVCIEGICTTMISPLCEYTKYY